VERADARSRQIDRPDGVVDVLQVKANTVEPRPCSLARNLFTKHRDRVALSYEPEPAIPKIARIVGAKGLTSPRPRLAGTGAGPDGSVIWPSCEPQGVAPSSDAGEEMALNKSGEV
jgi:hypothetical protein